jgi:hypothetical protein
MLNEAESCLFVPARAMFQLSGGCHHCRWQGCKFRLMLLTTRLLALRVLLHATPTATWDLRFLGHIWKIPDSHFWMPCYWRSKKQSLNVLSWMRPAQAGLKLSTSKILSESTTTRICNQWRKCHCNLLSDGWATAPQQYQMMIVRYVSILS